MEENILWLNFLLTQHSSLHPFIAFVLVLDFLDAPSVKFRIARILRRNSLQQHQQQHPHWHLQIFFKTIDPLFVGTCIEPGTHLYLIEANSRTE